jgi:integrase
MKKKKNLKGNNIVSMEHKIKRIKDKNDCKWVMHIYIDDETNEQYVLMGLQSLKHKEIFIPSPISYFTIYEAGNKTSSQKNAADVIVRFLNFILEKDKDIFDINVELGAEFLSSRNICNKTANFYAAILENFYRFLKDNEIIDFDEKDTSLFMGKYRVSVDKKKKTIQHTLKPEYLPLLFSTASERTPDIELGLYFQIFGGLRASEVVSIEYNDISYTLNDGKITRMSVELKDKVLRPDLEYGNITKVKINRTQEIVVTSDGYLDDLFKKHKDKYKSKNTNCVFIDKNGNPMTSSTYRYRFTTLKNKFIEKLSNSTMEDRSYAIELSSTRWNTHIGRGIFSNNAAKSAKNAAELAAWRGDRSYDSANAYLVDTPDMGEMIEDLMEISLKGNDLNKEE